MRLFPRFHSESDLARLYRYAETNDGKLQTLLSRWEPQRCREMLNTPNYRGDTVLHFVAARPKALRQVGTLLRHGADPNVLGWYGLPPRLHALGMGNTAAAQVIAAYGGRAEPGQHNELSARGMLAHVFGLGRTSVYRGAKFELMGARQAGVFDTIATTFAAFCRDPEARYGIRDDVAQGITRALSQAPRQDHRPVEDIVADIAAGEAVVIPTGWKGHATSHCFLDDHGVRINRQETELGSPTWSVMKVRDTGAIASVVRTVLAFRNTPALAAKLRLSWQKLMHRAPRRDPVRKILAAQPCRDQSVGNCSVASAKPTIFALLVLYDERTPEGAPRFVNVRALYKHFTTYLRYVVLRDYLRRHATVGWDAPDEGLVQAAFAALRNTGREKTLPPGWRQELIRARDVFDAAQARRHAPCTCSECQAGSRDATSAPAE